MRAPWMALLAGMTVAIAVLAGALPASAATVGSWSTWQPLTGTSGAYATSVQIAAHPDISATMTTDSRSGQIGVISGVSTWLSEGTSIGAKYGSSRNQPYLNLRPKADNATSPSTTTYSFTQPTPTSGWAFALGDIDSDSVRIRAVAPDGHVLDATEIGLRDLFNYCAPGVVGKPSCTGAAEDVPAWDPATLTLTGNPTATDTNGSAAWFEPTTPISSLTFIFARRSGLPVYQTWFASLARDITGTVAQAGTGLPAVGLSLTDANGVVVGSTTTAADGTYSFPGFVATDGYVVRVTPPAGKIADDAVTLPADITDSDAVVNFVLRDIVPVAVSGRVIDDAGQPVAGVTVSIDAHTTTTDADGNYLFDQVALGEHTATIVMPAGYSSVSSPPPFTVPVGVVTPIENVNFRIAENPSLSGTVRWSGTGVAGVMVTASGPGGTTLTAVTGAGGDYTFPGLPAGSYVVTMTTPDGYIAESPVSRTEPVTGTDVVGVDFDLARLGAIDGTVLTEGGAPVGGVVIEVSGPGGATQLTTDADGSYGLGSLPPGTYQLTVKPPTGSTIVGPGSRTVEITDAGEAVSGQGFVLTNVITPPSPSPEPSTGAGTGTDRLSGTGLGPQTLAWAVGGAVVLVLGATLLIVARRRSRRK